MNEYTSQQDSDVTDHQKRDEQVRLIAAASNRYR